MGGTLPCCDRAVVTGLATAAHLGMVDGERLTPAIFIVTGLAIVARADVLRILGTPTYRTAWSMTGGAVTARPLEEATDMTTGTVFLKMRPYKREPGGIVIKTKLSTGGHSLPLQQQPQTNHCA